MLFAVFVKLIRILNKIKSYYVICIISHSIKEYFILFGGKL